jgi:hypothetical protein
VNSVGILVEDLDHGSIDCNVSRDSIELAARYPFSAAKFQLVDPLSASDNITFYITVSTLYFANVDGCVSALRLSVYYRQIVKLVFSERNAFANLILWENGNIISSQR